MGTISVKLKVIADDKTKKNIFSSYTLFNEYVAMFERFFLLAQQRDYFYKDANGEEQYVSKEEVEAQLRDYLIENTHTTDVDECMEVLKCLNSVIENKGTQAAGMLAKLYNKESTAGTNNITKIVTPEPEWMKHYDMASDTFEPGYKEKADKWIASKEGQKAIEPVLGGSGRPSAFKGAYLSGKAWYKAFVKDQNTYKKDLADGLSKMLNDLTRLDALPLIKIPDKLITDYPVWIKLFLKTALENYGSYLASDKTTRSDYDSVCVKFDSFASEVDAKYGVQLEKIKTFLNDNYTSDLRVMCLTGRMCRGASEIYAEWKKKASYEERKQVLNDYQSDKTKQQKVGDVNLFDFLAKEENQDITEKVLDEILKYYDLFWDKNSKKCCAAFTAADPVNSQRYLFYEKEGGSNFRSYKISQKNGLLSVTFPLLLKKDNTFEEEETVVDLAKNRQFQGPYNELSKERESFVELTNKSHIRFSTDKKVLYKGCSDIAFETFEGEIGGADLIPQLSASNTPKDFFFSFTITVNDFCTDKIKKLNTEVRYAFLTAYDGKHNKHSEALDRQELRALSVDLGLKHLGACAVGGIKFDGKKPLQEGISFERQFMINLEGEKCSSVVEKHRFDAEREIHNLKTSINYLSFLKTVYNIEDESKKRKKIQQYLIYTKSTEKAEIMQYCLGVSSVDSMNECLKSEYSRIISSLNDLMKDFRSGEKTKKQKRDYHPGKSYWAISYLEDLRKLLMAWNSLGINIDVENKIMSRQYGVTATRLLEHINNLKDDRIKSGADMIVQSARGFAYDDEKNCWVERYSPCNVIVFEDLSRYRFKIDRPKKENSKLMKWAHSAIIKEVTRQAGVYGIEVVTVDAAFTSKFYNITGTPGIRCDRLTKNDFDANGNVKEHIVNYLPENMQKISCKFKVGDIIPAEIGSLFVTKKDGKLTMVNADFNAACNLQMRFWTQRTHIYRLATENVGGHLKLKTESTEEDSMGKIQRGQYLKNFGTRDVMLVDAKTKGHFCVVKQENSLESPNVQAEREYSLFNDPSGEFFKKDEWIGYKEFWLSVQKDIVEELVEIINK